jgi:CHAD domain-containing protein
VAAKAVAVRTEEVFVHHEQALAVEDIEALHDMRVATRRLRAALEVFEPSFPRHSYRRVLRDVKRLADALGERRDRDVQIEWLERYAGERKGEERSAVMRLVGRLRAEQAAANEALAEVFEQVQSTDLQGRLQELAARAVTGSHTGTQTPAAGTRAKNAQRRNNGHGGRGAAPSGSDAALSAGRRR